MDELFNEHSAHLASKYVYHHPEDEMFVSDDLPEPNLINQRGRFLGISDQRRTVVWEVGSSGN